MSSKTAQDHLSDLPEWEALEEHYLSSKDTHLRDLFAGNPKRFDDFHHSYEGLLFDYSKQPVTAETLGLLCDLARARDVEGLRNAMFAGARLNTSEDRACLHTALRSPVIDDALEIDGDNVAMFVRDLHAQMRQISDKIRANPNITDVVNIGVGGSDLGPRMVCEVMASQRNGPKMHFLSNVDSHSLQKFLRRLDPDNTVFLIASKSFTTLETMTNAHHAKEWAGKYRTASHFIAMTSNSDKATEFGIATENILPMRDWIGGRFSIWSSIGLPIALMLGFERFEEFLAGAAAADKHFLETPLESNIPVIMAMIDIWHRNFHGRQSLCILPYADRLCFFPAYVQQITMESNGKDAPHATAPVVFGQTGTDAQHAFMQAFHQGSDIVPCEFIVNAGRKHGSPTHYIQLSANALAQAEALMMGCDNEDEPHMNFKGNRPSSTLILDDLSPYRLGLLMALYEHRVFVQGAIWGINSFDQWGVELGKTLANDIIAELEERGNGHVFDSSTAALVKHLKERL